jgi:hypothetical protein
MEGEKVRNRDDRASTRFWVEFLWGLIEYCQHRGVSSSAQLQQWHENIILRDFVVRCIKWIVSDHISRGIYEHSNYQWWRNRSRSEIPQKAREARQKDQRRRSIEELPEDIFRTYDSNWSHGAAIPKWASWHAISELKMIIEAWEKKNLARTECLSKIYPYSASNNNSENYWWNLWGYWRCDLKTTNWEPWVTRVDMWCDLNRTNWVFSPSELALR